MESRDKKWFLRCCGCLSVMATVAERPAAGLKCAACSSRIEIMGVVRQSRLVKIEQRTPCDDRCCFAAGPECNCQCEGANHGSKITVQVVRDMGGIPKVAPLKPEKAVRIYSEWTTARGQAIDRIRKHYPHAQAYKDGRASGLSAWDFSQALRGSRFLDQVRLAGDLKTHSGRLKALEKIQSTITEAAK